MKEFLLMIWNKIAGLFSRKNRDKAREIAALIGDLMGYAIPAVSFVASRATTSSTIVQIAALLKELKAAELPDPDKPVTKMEKRGLLLGAASLIIRGKIEEAIARAGAAGIVLAGRVIRSAAEIPGHIIDAAAQNAYVILKASLQEPDNAKNS